MKIRLTIIVFFLIQNCFTQIKKQEHKDFRTAKEIEQETVIQKMKDNFKNNYLFLNNDFYSIDSNLSINGNSFYTFKGIGKLNTISPIDCESKYALDKEKNEIYNQSENSIFKKERAPRDLIPFYLTSVFTKLENIYSNYHIFYARDFSFNLIENNNKDFYHLSFRSKNSKLPIYGKIILYKINYLPKSIEYTINSDYTFEMSSDNFNHKKSLGYTTRVLKELVQIEFQNLDNQFFISKYQSEYEFKNEQNNSQEKINGDIGNSKIILEYFGKEAKTCKENFSFNTLN